MIYVLTVRLDIFIAESVKGIIDHKSLPLVEFKMPAEAGREAI
jgi:hypothetical protein